MKKSKTLQGKEESKQKQKLVDIKKKDVNKKSMLTKHKTVNIGKEIKSFIRSLIKSERQDERDKIWQKCFDIMFDLTQSHDCDKDTACKLEDRAFRALRKMEKIK